MVKKISAAGLLSPVFFCIALWPGFSLLPRAEAAQAMLLPTADLSIGQQAVHVEIAATQASRQHGLMDRSSLPPDQGMLFVFDETAVQCFWMKNTLLPLSIAFIDSRGVILAIADMRAQSLDVHCPPGPIRYALEMRQGWFAQHRIQTGLSVAGLPR